MQQVCLRPSSFIQKGNPFLLYIFVLLLFFYHIFPINFIFQYKHTRHLIFFFKFVFFCCIFIILLLRSLAFLQIVLFTRTLFAIHYLLGGEHTKSVKDGHSFCFVMFNLVKHSSFVSFETSE